MPGRVTVYLTTFVLTALATGVPAGTAEGQTCVWIDQGDMFPELQQVIEPKPFFDQALASYNGDGLDREESGVPIVNAGDHDGFVLDTWPELRVAYLDYRGQTEDGWFLYNVTGTNTHGCTAQSTADYLLRKLPGHALMDVQKSGALAESLPGILG